MRKLDNRIIPFPQADDFTKIIEIINIADENKLMSKTYTSKILGDITDRQVSYYISAAMYLGVLDSDKKFTEFGTMLRSCSTPQQQIELCIKIISNPIFGELYFGEKILNFSYDIDDVIEIMKKNKVKFESDALYKRRAQTIISWVKWINSIMCS